MKLFDAFLYSDACSDADLRNLHYFGVERLLTCAHAPRAFDTAYDLLDYFEHLIGAEADRVARAGLTPHVAVGLHRDATPRRAHYELWRELPELLREPRVAALGELVVPLDPGDAEGWGQLQHQLRILDQLHLDGLRKPALCSLPSSPDSRARRAALARLRDLIAPLNTLTPADIALQNADWLTLDAIEAAGFVALLSVGPFSLTADEALQIIHHHDRRRLLLSTALRPGPNDILALPKLAVLLHEAGLDPRDTERLLYGNAMNLLVRSHGGADEGGLSGDG